MSFVPVEMSLPENIICGYYDSEMFTNNSSKKRILTMFEINIFTEDGGEIYCNQNAYAVSKDYIHIGIPGDITDRKNPLKLKSKFLKFNVGGRIAELLQSAPRYFYAHNIEKLIDQIDTLITIHTVKDFDEVRMYSVFLDCLSLILKASRKNTITDFYKKDICENAKNYMKENFNKPIQLSDISASVGLSPNYFHTLFTKTYGMSPRSYLYSYRIGIAKKLLCTTADSLGLIAEKCGFCDQQHMSNIFKKNTGISPGKFRKDNQKDYLVY